VEFRTDKTYSISLYDVVSGSYTPIGWQSSIASYTPSNPVMVRLQVSNGNARLKTWAAATPEPDHWQVSGTTQVPGPGRIGLGAILSSGNTNADPEVSFGALRVPNPQHPRHQIGQPRGETSRRRDRRTTSPPLRGSPLGRRRR